MHESSGLRQLLIEAGLYSNVTVNQIFDGKHYNRAVRTQKLLYEVLYRKKLQSVVEWMKRTEHADPLLLASETMHWKLSSLLSIASRKQLARRARCLYSGIHPFIAFRFFFASSALSVMVIGNFMLTV